MMADFALVVALCLPVIALGYIIGVRFATGLLGVTACLQPRSSCLDPKTDGN